MTALTVALLLVALGRLMPPAASDPPWRWSHELGLAVLCGLLVAPLGGAWLMRFHMLDGIHFAGDFGEYCSAVVSASSGDLSDYTHNRSVLPARLSALLLPRLGLLDAMLAASTASLGVLAAGLYLWGRALHSRLAGVAAALSACALAPLLLLSRMLSFYPEITATFTLAAGLTAVAMRVRSITALAMASAGVMLCLLIDLRGLLFALSFLVVIGAAALRAPPRRWPIRLAVPALFLALGWSLADQAYLPQTASLEAQVDLRHRLSDRGVPIPRAIEERLSTAYVWGRSDPREIPATLIGLQRQSAALPPGLLVDDTTRRHLDAYLRPWSPLLPAAGLVGVLGLLLGAGGGWRLLALVGTATPFLVGLKGAVELQRAFLRFLATGEPVLALALGLGIAVLVEGGVRAGRAGWRGALRLVVGGGAVLLLVLGVVPSPISPVADWRTPIPTSDRAIHQLLDAFERRVHSDMPACVRQLRADEAAGLDPRGRLYGGLQEPVLR